MENPIVVELPPEVGKDGKKKKKNIVYRFNSVVKKVDGNDCVHLHEHKCQNEDNEDGEEVNKVDEKPKKMKKAVKTTKGGSKGEKKPAKKEKKTAKNK